MQRTMAFALTTLQLALSIPCSAQDEDANAALFRPFRPLVHSGTMDSMGDGLVPLTLFISTQVLVMALLALVITAYLRRTPRALRDRAARSSAAGTARTRAAV